MVEYDYHLVPCALPQDDWSDYLQETRKINKYKQAITSAKKAEDRIRYESKLQESYRSRSDLLKKCDSKLETIAKIMSQISNDSRILIYGDDIWHTVTHTRGITGFVGPKGRPLALNEDEIRKMHLEKVKVDFTLEVGNDVEILSGALAGTVCKVTKVDEVSQRCDVVVNMFGRETPLQLSYSEIKKLA